ncbi:hypothetical protein Tco_1093465 [Tanacetum coccineum]|uniref:Uncharacterized protein n=1 Tax=Tanacetum coccineum TaxID=301880 RepID=A0ABQ5IET8_9ASTR
MSWTEVKAYDQNSKGIQTLVSDHMWEGIDHRCTITAEKKPAGLVWQEHDEGEGVYVVYAKGYGPYERTPQYPCSNLVLIESSFGTLVETSIDGPARLVFGPAGVALGPAELAPKTLN